MFAGAKRRPVLHVCYLIRQRMLHVCYLIRQRMLYVCRSQEAPSLCTWLRERFFGTLGTDYCFTTALLLGTALLLIAALLLLYY